MTREADPSETAIYQLGVVLGNAMALRSSLLFLAADERDTERLNALIAAAKNAAKALGVTIWDEEDDAERDD